MAPRTLAPKGVSKKRGGVDAALVRVQAVKGLPNRQRTVSKTQLRYKEAMAKVRAKGRGKGWFSIAEFTSKSGAAVVKRQMLAGDRIIDGKVSDWDIETRRKHRADGEVVGSELYVRLK